MIDEAVDALAVARLTRLLIEDRVPFGMVRRAILDRAWERAEPGGTTPPVAEFLSCPWCASMWVAGGVLVVRRSRFWRPLALVLAASEVAGLLAHWSE